MVLGDAACHGTLLWAHCLDCRHRAALDPAEHAQWFGYDCPVADVTPRLKCSRCGSRRGEVTTTYTRPETDAPGEA